MYPPSYPLYTPVVGKMTTFDLWPLPLGGGAWCAGTNIWHPETPASYESLPAPLATQIPTFWIHKSGGRGRGGALILDRCRAFDLFASVDAHLCSNALGPTLQVALISTSDVFVQLSELLKCYWSDSLTSTNNICPTLWASRMLLTRLSKLLECYWSDSLNCSNAIGAAFW